MNFWNKLERKFGKYAIKNLSLMLIICYAIGYLIIIVNPEIQYILYLNPYLILHGQIWRLVTWVLIPPETLSFFTLIMLYFYYSIGTNLEHTWGTFRYNVYLFSGMLFTIIGSFCLLGFFYLTQGTSITLNGASNIFSMINGYRYFAGFSTYYINMSIFLAFAMTFPEIQVFLFFVVPIKVKVLGIIYAIMLVVSFLSSDITQRFVIGASLLNVVAFFLCTRNLRRIDPREIRRRRNYQQQIKTPHGISKHKCAICGRTEKDGEDLEFRFCSKCNGNYEYCQEHLFTHEHVR
ncbi:MAG: rhomboid family intramembrane serine protease [Lachnospiraceae bacterium]|jgi:hypothetical protein|nr:rhomboid family intramembrane serine protease [Lachnospiraceae bacterium]